MGDKLLLFPPPARIRRYGENGSDGGSGASAGEPPIGGDDEEVCTFGPYAGMPWGNTPPEARRRLEKEWRVVELVRSLTDEQKDYMLALGKQLQRRARRRAAHDLNRK